MNVECSTHRVGSRAVKPLVLTFDVPCRETGAVAAIKEKFGDTVLSFVMLFVSPEASFDEIVADATDAFPGVDVAACTTAGEISAKGYDEGRIIAMGFPAEGFAATSLLIENLSALDAGPLSDRIAQERVALQEQPLDMAHSFAFLVVDGLSLREDALTATLAPALRDMPLFGGSAGDGTDFEHTFVALNGKVVSDAAILTMVRSRYRTHVFSLDHFRPSDRRMVVTEADPERRIVKSINAGPAAREYARMVGKDPEQLDQFTFASHPVVVRFGDTHHVRAIQQVNEAGELVFFSAIDEGMVLTVASTQNMVTHLNDKLAELAQDEKPAHILSCDCLLRRIEADQTQMTRDLSSLLTTYNVTGFSTYGEQIGPLHVNQTMTGVAIYGPDD